MREKSFSFMRVFTIHSLQLLVFPLYLSLSEVYISSICFLVGLSYRNTHTL